MIQNIIKPISDLAKVTSSINFWQPILFYKEFQKMGFKKIETTSIFSCDFIFETEEEAKKALIPFIRSLITKGLLSENVIKDDRTINEEILEAAIKFLSVSNVEKKEVSEKNITNYYN